MKKPLIIGAFALGAGALAYVALIGDPAIPVGPPMTADLTRVAMPDNQGGERLTPTGDWTAVTAEGERISGRSQRHADLEEGQTVCIQRYRRDWSGHASASIVRRGPCADPG